MSHEKKIEAASAAKKAPRDDAPDELLLQLNVRLRLDEVADLEAVMLRSQARREPTGHELRSLARRIYESRRLRDRVLKAGLFGEPAWDMLLALFYMPRQGKLLSVSGLCYAAGVPLTTALRWQTVLADEGLIERGPDKVDRRRQFMRLTDKGRKLMQQYLTQLFYADTPTPLSAGEG